MPATSLHTRTTVAEGRSATWAPCPTCWGQRRIWDRVPVANGEGAVLIAASCPGCLGVGEVLR